MMRLQKEISDIKADGDATISNHAFVESFSEDELDEFMIRDGVFDKMLSQLEQTPPNTNWEAELDEL